MAFSSFGFWLFEMRFCGPEKQTCAFGFLVGVLVVVGWVLYFSVALLPPKELIYRNSNPNFEVVVGRQNQLDRSFAYDVRVKSRTSRGDLEASFTSEFDFDPEGRVYKKSVCIKDVLKFQNFQVFYSPCSSFVFLHNVQSEGVSKFDLDGFVKTKENVNSCLVTGHDFLNETIGFVLSCFLQKEEPQSFGVMFNTKTFAWGVQPAR